MGTDIQTTLNHPLNVLYLKQVPPERKVLRARMSTHLQEARGVFACNVSRHMCTYTLPEGPHAHYETIDMTTKGRYGQR